MAGFFGLFGGGKDKETQVKAEQKKGSFFLESDEAKSLGNLDYMRQSNKIRRTFPKTRNNNVTEVIKEVSSLSSSSQSNQSGRVIQPKTTSTSNQPKVENQTPSRPRRSADSSMDLFRNMARDLKK